MGGCQNLGSLFGVPIIIRHLLFRVPKIGLRIGGSCFRFLFLISTVPKTCNEGFILDNKGDQKLSQIDT